MAEGTRSDQPIENTERPTADAGDTLSAEARSNINELVAKVDAAIASPSVRALKVWNALDKSNLTVWDLLCFTVESQGFLAPMFPEYQSLIKQINLSVYRTHYFRANDIAQWEQALPDEIPEKLPDNG